MKKKNKKNLYYSELSKILSSKKRIQKINDIKNLLPFHDLCDVTDTLAKSVKPCNFSIFGNPLPSTIQELGKGEMLFQPISLENEFHWTFITIRKYSNILSLFIILKEDFEKFFLIGNYIDAEKTLDTILKETGYSIWYIEARFLLYEYQDRSEEQKEFLSSINEVNKNLFVGTLAHFLSFRTERNLSAYKYDYDIKSLFSKTSKIDEREIRQYYSFRLNYFENYNKVDYSTLLVFENCNSLIDRYLLSVDILKALSLDVKTFNFAYSKALYLHRKTDDKTLLPILSYKNFEHKNTRYFDVSYSKILDLYYSGLYEEVIEEVQNYIIKKPSNFDLVIIYIRCYINLKREIKLFKAEENSIINQLAIKIYGLMNNGKNRNEIIYNLYQISKNVLSFEISASLNNFIKKEQKIDIDEKLKLISLNKFDPFFSKIYNTEEAGRNFLIKSNEYIQNSTSTNYWINFLGNELQEQNGVSQEIFTINKAKILFKKEEYTESIIEWENIIEEFYYNMPILQTALKYLFNCFVKTEQFDLAISLYVNQYIKNSNSVIKIDSKYLLDILRKKRYTDIKRSINLPIFVSLCSNDDTEKSFILEQFCKIYKAKFPSELMSQNIDTVSEKVELFYFNVCNSEVLKHSIYLNNTIERLNERLKIVNNLKDNSTKTDKKYIEEVNLISNELIIYEGTLKLEESKIYANDQAIINYELKDIDGLYNRFKTIYNLALKDKKILIITDKTYAFVKFHGSNDYNKTDVKYSDSALIDVFFELFDSILDKYLFSNFGIVAYLSTRIRHGVLLGELRPELEKQNLILNSIGESDKYESSRFWNSNYFALTDKKKDELHNILSAFSLNIDSLIEDIIKNRIQIRKDGKNECGLFNYEFDKVELSTYINTISTDLDTKAYCQSVIDILWQRTDANLEVIREYINLTIKNRFAEELSKLESNLRNSFKVEELPKIFTNVTESNTIIENKIKKISSWFRRSGSTIDDFDVKKVFEIVWNNTQKCYPKLNVNCSVSIKENPIIRSSYYIHFTDLFRILLDNMFKYGSETDGKKNLEFQCSEDNGFLKLKFINTVKDIVTDLPFKTNSEGQLLVDTNKLISEGKSGISKAIKIVKLDLDNDNNYIQISTENFEKFEVIVSIEIKKLLQNE